MCYDYYAEATPVPVKKRILFAIRDLTVAAKLRADMADAALTTVSPDFDCFETGFDVIVMCFDPHTASDQRWFHSTVKPKLGVNGTIYWATY